MKAYALLVATLGIGAIGVAAWGTKVTLPFVAPPSSMELFRTEYWLGLGLFWVFGVGAFSIGVAMFRQVSRVASVWEVFTWVLGLVVIVWNVIDVSRGTVGLQNLVEIAGVSVLAVSATLVRRQAHQRVAT